MTTAQKPVTAEQLYRLSSEDDGHRYELLAGELIRMVPAGGQHGKTALTVGAVLRTFVRQHELGEVASNDVGVFTERAPDTVLAPDVAYWSRDRLAELPEGFVDVPPDLAVEVVSPNDTQTRLHEKVLHYLDHGVRLVWIVDPRTRTATVYRSRHEVRILEHSEEVTGEDVLPGFSYRVGELFE